MGLAIRLGRNIRHAARLQQIVTVLVRHGFEDVFQGIGVDRLLDRVRRFLLFKKADDQFKRLPYEVRLRRAMEHLGGTFIKLGQILSTRPDLIPQHWADEFRHLQDDVPPVDFSRVRRRLEDEFPGKVDELFTQVEVDALAAGSIAQVHRATLRDGTPIVLKVLRPEIEHTVQADMEILSLLADFIEDRFPDQGYSPSKVVEQFRRELMREMDFNREGRSTDRLRRAFEDDENIIFPRVFWEASTSKVLALEYIEGLRLSRMKPDDLSDEDKQLVVARGADAVFRQCLEIGFFHADPHPGNIVVLPGARICFLDCGMTGHIDPGSAQLLADLIQGVVNQDLNGVIRSAIRMSNANPSLAHDRAFRADAWEFVSRFRTTSIDELQMGDLLRDFFEKIRRHRLQCPADLVFLVKAITTIESVGEELYPDFDLVGHVRPHIERLIRRRYSLGAMSRRFAEGITGYAQLAEELPEQMRLLSYDLRHNRIAINIKHSGFEDLIKTVEHASRNIAHATFVVALILGPSILILADSLRDERGWLTVVAVIGYILAALMVVGRFVLDRFRR
ncbi:MAG: hypothetical protein JJU36_06380 [Phycisphaeraceae bacterium]|nr:hypothetical protein [Phycisphaeraceae bacterium]